MKPDPTTLYPTDDCMIEGFSVNYPMGQIVRDDCWFYPELESDPFNSRVLELDPLEAIEAPKEWISKESLTPIPEAAWQRLANDLKSPIRQYMPSLDASLTPALAALEIPKEPVPEMTAFPATNECRLQMEEQRCFQSFPQVGEVFGQSYPAEAVFGPTYPAPPHFSQPYPPPGPTTMCGCQEGDPDPISIGTYTRSERAAKILRYRQKRIRRNYSKRVLYGCRKRFADSRPRVGGRFVINENRVIKPKTFLKRGRPRKTAVPLVNYITSSFLD